MSSQRIVGLASLSIVFSTIVGWMVTRIILFIFLTFMLKGTNDVTQLATGYIIMFVARPIIANICAVFVIFWGTKTTDNLEMSNELRAFVKIVVMTAVVMIFTTVASFILSLIELGPEHIWALKSFLSIK
jgi:hypothetical protein